LVVPCRPCSGQSNQQPHPGLLWRCLTSSSRRGSQPCMHSLETSHRAPRWGDPMEAVDSGITRYRTSRRERASRPSNTNTHLCRSWLVKGVGRRRANRSTSLLRWSGPGPALVLTMNESEQLTKGLVPCCGRACAMGFASFRGSSLTIHRRPSTKTHQPRTYMHVEYVVYNDV
jgi:hypothetical protein